MSVWISFYVQIAIVIYPVEITAGRTALKAAQCGTNAQ